MNIILLNEGETFLPSSDDRAKHIRKILHMGVGDSFRAGIINGYEGNARITASDEKGITIDFTPTKDSSGLYPLTMIIAQVRPICMRRILRETVSLGVSHLILPVSDLGEKSYLEASLYTKGEYKDILLDGAMQAGATGVSRVSIVKNVEEAVASADGDVHILLDNAVGATPLSRENLEGKSVVLAIGPERGWSGRERQYFIDNDYRPMLLGDRILRTETAAVAGAAMTLAAMKLL